jgi:uncharacterized Zn finger protein
VLVWRELLHTSLQQGAPLVQIVDVTCPSCHRKFRTVPSVLEHAGSVRCSACGTPMVVSDPQPVAVLNEKS